jgi:predicted outer membrane repeat protein
VKKFCFFLISVSFLLLAESVSAKIIHVPSDSSTIQAGINGASDGDTVLVARGHYYERINFLGKALLVTSNFIFDSLETTIDSTIIDADTSVLGISDTGSVVTFIFQEDSTSAIKGFTIRNGIGTLNESGYRDGGGIYCLFSSPMIDHNIITYNCAINGFGGAIYCDIASRPIVWNNLITANSAVYGGGILCLLVSSPIIHNNSLINNSASSYGGGICCVEYSAPLIDSNSIIGNSSFAGGGICCMYRSSPTILNNVIASDSAGHYGGAICCEGYSAPTINNNTITGTYGIGICCDHSAPAINNNTIADTYGMGIYCDHSAPAIRNNIISNSLDGAGIACDYNSNPTIYHNDVWNNADGNFYDCPAGVGDTTWGTNFNATPCDSFYNIIRDPLFTDTIDFELLCNSPCIDAGDPSIYVPPDSGGCRTDMGAREYPYILGDANSDGTITPKESRMGAVDLSDLVFIANYLFQYGPPPCPYHAADTNCDGEVDIADIVCLVNYLFIGGPLPC